ncbi:MAG: caspase family protein [Cyanobacteria bacterium J06659_2]
MTQTFAHGYALLIGVGQCADPQLSLPATVKDMQALRQILVNPNLCAYPDNDQHLRLLHDQEATQQGILEGLTWLRTQVKSDPQATAIVYYSGHGWLEPDSDRYYLIPHDFDAYDWRDTALSADAFNEALRQISAKRLLVILDCCHAAGMASAKGEIVEPRRPKGVIPTADPKGLIDALSQGEGRVVFTSCRGKQSSWVRDDQTLSIYTHHLIEALQGAASQSGATEVTVFDLANHLGKAVPESAAAMGHEQNPRFEMADTERFTIALLQGGKGLPKGGWGEVKAQSQSQIQITIDNSVTQTGDRAVAAQNAQGATINTGDGNIFGNDNVVQNVNQQGKYSISIGNAQNLKIGDTYNTDQDDD